MRQVQARESPREDTDTPNVNDTFEHVVAPLSPSLFLSRSLQVSPWNLTHFTIHCAIRRNCTSDTFGYRYVETDCSQTHASERTNE